MNLSARLSDLSTSFICANKLLKVLYLEIAESRVSNEVGADSLFCLCEHFSTLTEKLEGIVSEVEQCPQ